MHQITFISTVHENTGFCNADELHEILVRIKPEVVFLEELESNYSEKEHSSFLITSALHTRLELAALQKLSLEHLFDYIPVLDEGLSDYFDAKYNNIQPNKELNNLSDVLMSNVGSRGFDYLNCNDIMELHRRMRKLENELITDKSLITEFDKGIDEYENSMLKNIYSYCENNSFERAVFMCGSAHRESLIKKFDEFNSNPKVKIDWVFYGESPTYGITS